MSFSLRVFPYDSRQFFRSNFLVISDNKVNNAIVLRGSEGGLTESQELVVAGRYAVDKATHSYRKRSVIIRTAGKSGCAAHRRGPCSPVTRCPYCLVTDSRKENQPSYLRPSTISHFPILEEILFLKRYICKRSRHTCSLSGIILR
jgi:hypothetical protein